VNWRQFKRFFDTHRIDFDVSNYYVSAMCVSSALAEDCK